MDLLLEDTFASQFLYEETTPKLWLGMHSNLLFSPVALPLITAADKRRYWLDSPIFIIISVVISVLYFPKCHLTYNFLGSCVNLIATKSLIIYTHLHQVYVSGKAKATQLVICWGWDKKTGLQTYNSRYCLLISIVFKLLQETWMYC